MRRVSIFFVFLILMFYTLTPIGYGLEIQKDYMLYVYGSRSCPHCHTLANYLIDENISFTWFWIENEANLNYLKTLVEDLDISEGTPTTIVYVEGKPVAIVLGAITDNTFWRNIVENSGEILKIYYGDQLYKEMPIPNGFTEKYIAKEPADYKDVYTYAKGEEPANDVDILPTIILIALLLGAAILIYLRK